MGRRRATLTRYPGCEINRAKGGFYVYYRHNRRTARIRLHATPGTLQFDAEYEAAQARFAGVAIGENLIRRGSARQVATAYLASEAFAGLSAGVQAARRREIERFAAKNAERMLGELTAPDVRALMRRITNPHARFKWRQHVGAMCKWALAEGLISHNVFRDVEAPEVPESTGHRRWEGEHVEAFRKHHKPGAWERRAFEAIYCLAARGQSDVAHLTRHNIKGDRVVFRATKNGAAMEVEISPAFAAELALWRKADDLLLFRNKQGGPIDARGERFGARFREAVTAAGLPADLTPHGIRHAVACEAAENGATVPEVAAILGDKSWRMAERYCRQANDKKLRRDGHARRTNAEPISQTDFPNREEMA